MSTTVILLLVLFPSPPDAATPAAGRSGSVVAGTRAADFRSADDGRNRRTAKLSGGSAVSRHQELIELIQSTIAPDSWAPNGPGVIFGAGAMPGGFGAGANAGGFGAGANPRASSLIDLIQTTIQPDSWEINGGNGVIVPFGK